jgi:hypothetical protein
LLLLIIHFRIGFAQKLVYRLLAVSRITVADRTAVLGGTDLLMYALGELDNIVFRNLAAYHDELVASDSVNIVLALYRADKTVRDGRNREVSCSMSLIIVDCLKSVHVDRYERRDLLRIIRYVSIKSLTVEKSRERVFLGNLKDHENVVYEYGNADRRAEKQCIFFADDERHYDACEKREAEIYDRHSLDLLL